MTYTLSNDLLTVSIQGRRCPALLRPERWGH